MYLSMLFPRNKKICVFGAWLGKKYADNSKALFIEAQKHSKLHAVWIAKDEEVVRMVRQEGYEAYTWLSIKGIWYQLRAKYAVISNGISDLKHAFLGNAVFINLWHGVPLKKIGYDDFYEKDWNNKKQTFRDKIINIPLGREYVVATSKTIAKIYQSAFRRPKEQILCLGQPRNDVFFANAFSTLFHGKKIILYAPTHRKEGKEQFDLTRILQLDQLEAFCEVNDYYFLVKKHFYHNKETEELSSYKHILDITNEDYDTQELLMAADVLITDYSSIYIDYLLLDRPIIFYYFDYEKYLQSDREMYFEYEKVTPGEKVKNFKEMLDSLNYICRNSGDGRTKERKEICDLFYSKAGQGMVGEKILALIEKGELIKN